MSAYQAILVALIFLLVFAIAVVCLLESGDK